jgi:hypothetical protein
MFCDFVCLLFLLCYLLFLFCVCFVFANGIRVLGLGLGLGVMIPSSFRPPPPSFPLSLSLALALDFALVSLFLGPVLSLLIPTDIFSRTEECIESNAGTFCLSRSVSLCFCL